MAISFVNKGAFASAATSISPALPASMASGDLCLLFIESIASATITVTVAGSVGTWTRVTNAPVSNGLGAVALSCKLDVFYGWWTSGTTAPTVTASVSNHITGIIMAFRGVDPTTPFDTTSVDSGTETTARTSVTPPAITTTTNNALVIYAIAIDADASSTNALSTNGANSNLTSYTVQHEQTVSTGLGGGLAVITGFKASAGSSGTFGTNPVSASCTHAYLTMALKESSPVNITVTVPTTVTHTISEVAGTTVSVVANITISPSTTNITISEVSGTEVSGSSIITIGSTSEITIDNNNPIISLMSKLMEISPTLQVQIAVEFIEGLETTLNKDGTLTMIEFIEGSTLNFDNNGKLTAFEFIEGGL